MITDADRVKWIAENVDYFEHGAMNVDYLEHGAMKHKYNFWPHEEEPGLIYEENKVGLSIIEYIDARIGESK